MGEASPSAGLTTDQQSASLTTLTGTQAAGEAVPTRCPTSHRSAP